ncbi:methylenetetrahydrofolate reductase [NAD(P)H] [Bradyrhizobium sp. LHD-71]|uniref:methylenetetrahydrofolate reductase [NAD(P)H] n=1 Tax=Bradyrhizobium sp. LHD-71 TaxID=3072141 RepID=UPI00280DD152|nr:methylenetetrahydrofolate reductase [NAD(P)H] [Bradyrhizobium sp. LHD-71]MDQ8726994.1 methylenetetrahydrofolate reductase [NAD(P)H] [Bradyrhizobium sp. LHD-71]
MSDDQGNAQGGATGNSGSRRLPRISFEFFPPKTEEMERTLWATIKRLAPLEPSFVSVTYGAGGSTRERTHATIVRILKETRLTPAAHLTCVDASRADIDEVVARYHDAGVRHIVALRGDPASGMGGAYTAHPDGYQTSAELVASIKKRYPDIEVSVSAYPEKHPQSADFDADVDTLKAKVDAGATRAITQFFFDNDLYNRYVDRVRARGVDVPIVPGILPVQNFKQMSNVASRCGASVPSWLAEKFEGLDDDPETRKLIAAAVAAGQVQKLNKHGVDNFHFYTMNRADLVFAISHLLGFRANAAREAA